LRTPLISIARYGARGYLPAHRSFKTERAGLPAAWFDSSDLITFERIFACYTREHDDCDRYTDAAQHARCAKRHFH